MDYNSAAKKIIEGLGGKENIVSAAHCATRLRLVIGDNDKCNKEFIENIDGVKGVFFASGQLQVIFGTGVVNKVYDEFIKEAGISEATKEDVKQAASAKTNVFKRVIKALGDVFVPIIPAIVASGLLMGLLEGLCNAFPEMANSGTYQIIHLFSNAAFVFLPVLIGMSAAQVFGGNKFLGAVIGMIMIHPDLMNAWNVAGADPGTIPQASVWFGAYSINLVGYQGHVIPVVIAVWFMSNLEKRLHKIVPEMIDLFVTPLVTVLVTGYLTLTIFGPVFSLLENYVLNGVQYLISIPFGIGSFIVGAVYAPTVVAGVHHMYNAIEAGMISSTGANTWMPIATAANVAQGAAALALALKTRNRKVKSMALPASLSAFLGITEPAIFGVNLRFFKPFIAGCIGGAFGALVASVLKVSATAYGITGVFGLLITTHCIVQYIIVMAVAFAVAFIVSWILFKDEKEEGPVQAETVTEFTPEPGTVYSPLKGEAIALKDVKDETFAGEVLGQGIAVIPENGVVVSPVNGKVETLFDTKHAIGITADDGRELLIHIGINTVELGGKYYTAFVSEGDEIKVGQKLIEFDIDEIKKAGYDITTPVIVTNSFDYESVTAEKTGSVDFGEKILTVR